MRRAAGRAGIGAAIPLGFAALAAYAPPGRLGQTMGGPLLVGAAGLVSLTAGLGALAATLVICAALIAPRNRASPPSPAEVA